MAEANVPPPRVVAASDLLPRGQVASSGRLQAVPGETVPHLPAQEGTSARAVTEENAEAIQAEQAVEIEEAIGLRAPAEDQIEVVQIVDLSEVDRTAVVATHSTAARAVLIADPLEVVVIVVHLAAAKLSVAAVV